MRLLALALCLLSPLVLADVGLFRDGVYVGPVKDVDCVKDGGLVCFRDGGTALGKLLCASATSATPGCVSTLTQTFAGNKTFTGTVKAAGVDAGYGSFGQLDLRGSTITSGSISSTFNITSSTGDGTTSATVPAMNFVLGSDITNSDLGWCFTDSAGNKRLCGTEAGSWNFTTHATDTGAATVAGTGFTSALGAGGISSGATPGATGGAYSFTAGTGGASAGSAAGGNGGAAAFSSGAGGASNGTQTGGAGGALSLTCGNAGGGRIGGAMTLTAGNGGIAAASYAAGAGGAITATAGTGGAESTSAAANGGAVSIAAGPGGAAASGTAGTGGALTLSSGGAGAANAGTGAAGGVVTIDTGAATGAATAAVMNIGTTNAGTVTLGRSGQSVATPGTLAATLVTVSSSININSAGNGTAIAESGATSAAIDFPNITTGTCSSQTMALTGVTTTSNLACQYPTALESGVLCMCFVSASGTVTFRCCAVNGGADINPASGTFRARYFR
jgi:hypothetical protein